MTTDQLHRSKGHPGTRSTQGRVAVAALAFGACAIGVSELAAIGVLGMLSDDVGVTVAAAGSIVTAYAAGVCVGGPLLAVLTSRWNRRATLVWALVAFVMFNVMIAVAPSLALIIAARVVAGAIHGLFVGLATAHAATLAEADRRGGAIAMVFGGIAVAAVVGAPVGQVVGEALGWRATFWGVALAAAAALLAVSRLVPPTLSRTEGAAGGVLQSALKPRIVGFLVLIVLVMGGVFTFYTYVTEFLTEATAITGVGVTILLLAFGVASAAGTLLGGRLADRSAAATMIIAAGCVTSAMVVLAVFGGSVLATAGALILCGLAAFAYVPAFQLRLIDFSESAPNLVATMGASAANAGIAIGAAVGGLAIGRGADVLTVVAAAVCAAGFAATLAATGYRRRS